MLRLTQRHRQLLQHLREELLPLLRRAHRPQARRAVVRERPRRQPDRSRVRREAQGVGLLDAVARHRVGIRRGAPRHDEEAGAREDPPRHPEPAGGRDQVVRVLHLRLPGRHAGVHRADRAVCARDRSRLRQFLPGGAMPRAPQMYEKCLRDGMLATDDWSKLEYSYYVLRNDVLNEDVVMGAIRRATRQLLPAAVLDGAPRAGPRADRAQQRARWWCTPRSASCGERSR
ncbi:MAG: hypothetical protein MZU84_03880 [Sphingobacterium sp.]|nr:hypothetical protein [Sphingobacterium sp.]